MSLEVVLIFDIGKTNKKLLIFDHSYRLVEEESIKLDETVDEDGFPCENVFLLTEWIKGAFEKNMTRTDLIIRAVNFSGYGASFVCVDERLKPVMALSNYLKPYPEKLKETFYKKYGGLNVFCKTCASPPLGSLNSGLQLYRIQHENSDSFKKIRWALHLPQYLSSILTKQATSDLTSIGCHTALWDFDLNRYHKWVFEHQLETILPEIVPSSHAITIEANGRKVPIGIGLHDSSAALIPYLTSIREPFVLLSTGTWNICLNPFNASALTEYELMEDCLCYLNYEGKPVKASRFFAGQEHELKVAAFAEQFGIDKDFFLRLSCDETGNLNSDDLAAFAYLDFMKDLVKKQIRSLKFVLGRERIQTLFVDGGFSKNDIFMKLLANNLPSMRVFAATIPQASALGAALAIHKYWNADPLPSHLIDVTEIKNNSGIQ
jgi:L-fuculokinase